MTIAILAAATPRRLECSTLAEQQMSSEADPLTHPPGLDVAPAQAEDSMQPAKAHATPGPGEATKPRVFPRRRPDLTEAQAEQREAMRAHPPADTAKE